MRTGHDRITATIKWEWLAEIIAGTKKIEYRAIEPYYKVTTNRRAGEYELHIKRILGFKHWDKRRWNPKR